MKTVTSQLRAAVGANALLVWALVLGLCGVVNEVAHRHRVSHDFSAHASASLDPDTVAAAALSANRADMTVTAFSSGAKDPREAQERDRLLRDFLARLARGAPHVQTRFVDFDTERITTEALGVTRHGTVLLSGGADRVDVIDRRLFVARGKPGAREVSFVGEPSVAAALRQVARHDPVRLAFLQGHGERPLYDRGLGELRAMANRVSQQGFEWENLDLVRSPEGSDVAGVPSHIDVVVVVGARTAPQESEMAALRTHVAQGRGLLWFVDVGADIPEWFDVIGVDLPTGVVLDEVSQPPHRDRPPLSAMPHAVTEALVEDGRPTVVALARPVVTVATEGVTVAPLLRTGRAGWIERGQDTVFDAGTDASGPIDVAVALALAPNEGRVVVVGDVDLIGDELLDEGPGNATFLAGVLRWLARADDAQAPVGRQVRVRRLEISAAQLGWVRVWLVLGLPLALLAAGGLVRTVRARA